MLTKHLIAKANQATLYIVRVLFFLSRNFVTKAIWLALAIVSTSQYITKSDYQHLIKWKFYWGLLVYPQLILAALNKPMSGNMSETRGTSCFNQAKDANLSGTFKSFLTSDLENLHSIVASSYRHLPVVNIKVSILKY